MKKTCWAVCLFLVPLCPISVFGCETGFTPEALQRHDAWLRDVYSSRSFPPPDETSALMQDGRRFVLCPNWKSVAVDDPEGGSVRKAELHFAKLEGASFNSWDFGGTQFLHASLIDTKFIFSEFVLTDFKAANLSGAAFLESNLRNANFIEAELSGTRFLGSDLGGAKFRFREPRRLRASDWLLVKGLGEIRFGDDPANPHSLTASVFKTLRDDLWQIGARREARELTAAIEHYRTIDAPVGERLMRKLLLELPVNYGAAPWRPLGILFGGIVLFALFYTAVFFRTWKRAGIWRVWHGERILDKDRSNDPELLRASAWKALAWALYFSCLSAFHIGWKDFNVGSWIARVQPREYALRATGWARSVAGIQSLLSVYLLAIWALTYFGRPFD